MKNPVREGVGFDQALTHLKHGRGAIRLPNWNPDVKVYLHHPTLGEPMTHEYLAVESRFGLVPWNPTQVEILSDEWILC